MPITEAEQVVTRFVAAWERADVDELLDYFTEDAIWHPMPMKPAVGRPALREALTVWLGATTQLGVQIHRQVSDGKTVMHERIDRFSLGTQEYESPICAVFEIDSGRIAARREYFDMSPYAEPTE